MTPELSSSLILTVVGMGTVFLFLLLTVIVVDVASKFLSKFAHLIEKPAPKKVVNSANKEDAEVVAAIAIAMQNR